MSKRDGWTQTPNKIYEAMAGMCEAELRVTLTVTRLTYGYQRDRAEVQYEDFMIIGGLSSKSSVSKGIKLMLRRGFFAKGNGRSEYVIKKAKSTVNEPLLPTESTVNELLDDVNGTVNELLPVLDEPKSTVNEPEKSTVNEPFQSYKENKKRGKEKLLPSPDLDLAEMVNALVDVTGLDGHRFWPVLSDEASAFLDGGYTAVEVLAFYLPDDAPQGWNWYAHDWRGRKGDRPKLKDVWETISGARRGPVGSNGRASPAPAVELLTEVEPGRY